MADAKTNNVVMTITIPKESSRVYAMNLIHWSAAKKMKEIDSEALLEKRMNLKAGTTRDDLKQTIIAKADEMMKAEATDQATDWGLEQPQIRKIHQKILDSKIEDLYKAALNKAMMECDEEQRRKEQLKTEKDDLDNEISKMQPEELLIATIDNIKKEITKIKQ